METDTSGKRENQKLKAYLVMQHILENSNERQYVAMDIFSILQTSSLCR